jgi:hypothetical protein
MPAVHPLEPEGARTFAWIEVRTAHGLANYGPRKEFHELLMLVPQTVERPDAILRVRGEESQGWCYARRHAKECTASRVLLPAAPGKVFVVFLTRRMLITDWAWVPCDPVDRALPLDDRTSDGVLLWRRTT